MKFTINILEGEKEIFDPKNDTIGFWSFSKNVSDLLWAIKPPFTIAIEGEWGSGKSSVLNFIKSELSDNKFLVIDFDAWFHRKELPLALPLICALIKKSPKEIKGKVRALFSGVYEGLKTVGEQIIEKKTGINLRKVQKNAEARQERNNKLEAYEKYFNKLETWKNDFEYVSGKIIGDSDKKIVVFVDNLDRCLPEHVIDFLEDLSNFFKSEKIVFVIALDKKVVQTAFLTRYGERADFDQQRYLEKIIDLTLSLPKIEESNAIKFLNKITFSILADLSSDQEAIIASQISKLKSVLNHRDVGNPRRISRLLKRLAVCLSFSEFEATDFARLFMCLYVKDAFPDAFSFLLHSSGRALETLTVIGEYQIDNSGLNAEWETKLRAYGDDMVALRSDTAFMQVFEVLIKAHRASHPISEKLVGSELSKKIGETLEKVNRIN